MEKQSLKNEDSPADSLEILTKKLELDLKTVQKKLSKITDKMTAFQSLKTNFDLFLSQ